MSHSLLTASRTTHVKIVVVALVCAIALVALGIAAHVSASGEVARLQAHGPVLKAGKPAAYSGHGEPVVR